MSTCVLLFLAFGSVVLPIKVIVTNVLSLSVTPGVVVWIFQWGHLIAARYSSHRGPRPEAVVPPEE